jgi:hypothetical protein
MEGLQFNTAQLLNFNAPPIKHKTAANYARNMEGLRFNNFTKKNTGKSKFKQSMNKLRKAFTRSKKH